MRITRDKLQEMIEESVEDLLLRSEHRRLVEAHSGAHRALRLAQPTDLMEFAQRFSSLGLEGQEALSEIVEDPTVDTDPRWVDLIEAKLSGMNDTIDEAVQLWREAHPRRGKVLK
jgi:hypothetical protein